MTTFFTQRYTVSPTSASVYFNTRNPNGVNDIQAVLNDGRIELHVLEDRDVFGTGTGWTSGYTQVTGVVAPGWSGPTYQAGSGGPITNAIAEVAEPGGVPPAYSKMLVVSDGRITWHIYLRGIAK